MQQRSSVEFLLGFNCPCSCHGGEDSNCGNLFHGSLDQITPLPKRVGRKKGEGRVVWDTGDAVLERIGAINWETKEYIVEDTKAFLLEITPTHRGVAIGDAEQLAASSIILACSHAEVLWLLVTDNRNVLAWERKGFAKKGDDAILNQETSKWMSSRRSQVEGVFIRSGRNFSPDWMTRTSYDAIEQWASHRGFRMIRLDPLWGEKIQDFRRIKVAEVTMPDDRVENTNSPNLLCVEWNSGGWRFVEDARRFGLTVQFAQSRHDLVTNQFCQRYGFGPYRGGDIFLFWMECEGGSRSDAFPTIL